MKDELTHERLLSLFSYDADTGLMQHKKSHHGRPVGSPVGGVSGKGYAATKINGKRYYMHRLAWLYEFGAWPDGHIDHINGDKSDNRIANLRDVTSSVNHQNLRGPKSHNKSGVLGVQVRAGKYFSARIVVDGDRIELGTFSTAEEAGKAYLDAKRSLHKGNTL